MEIGQRIRFRITIMFQDRVTELFYRILRSKNKDQNLNSKPYLIDKLQRID